MERRTPARRAFRRQERPCFAVPAAIFEQLAQELIGQCVVRFLEIRTDAENSTVDAGRGGPMLMSATRLSKRSAAQSRPRLRWHCKDSRCVSGRQRIRPAFSRIYLAASEPGGADVKSYAYMSIVIPSTIPSMVSKGALMRCAANCLCSRDALIVSAVDRTSRCKQFRDVIKSRS